MFCAPMTRIICFTEAGGPEVLRFEDVQIAAPSTGEVRIKVNALGVNRAEAMWRADEYIEPVVFPARLGYEAVGRIDAVGEGVEGLKVGDLVNTIPAFSMNQYGMYGELVLAPAYAVVRHPESLSVEQAASIWMMFMTAYGAIVEDARVSKGDAVIITAASSSVGLAAIQLTNYVGGTSIALTRTGLKKQRLLDAGAKHVISTDEQDVVAEVMRITEGKGARVVFDAVGGPGFPTLMTALSFRGLVYVYGALSSDVTPLPLLTLIGKMPTIKAHNIWLTSGDPTRQRAAVDFILTGIAKGSLKPVIDKVFKFDEMVDAHRYLEANDQFGKIVVTV
jgi:NADPH:quinone reductase-like Zn-dependent oxidoreductase